MATPEEEDDLQWEYEYSTSETETFYLNLDLSTADFTNRQTKVTPNGRGANSATVLGGSLVNKNVVQNTGGEPEVADSAGNHTNQQEAPQTVTDDEELDKVQIMELHSEHPIVSYRGRVFEGAWSHNVGTELLITRPDPDERSLPALRHLQNGVQLLAASSARITVTQKELKPKDSHRKRRGEDVDETDQLDHIVPPADRGASTARINQGDFLAKLITAKKRRGETDEVTVIAETQTRDRSTPSRRAAPRAYRERKAPGRAKSARGSVERGRVKQPRGGSRPRDKSSGLLSLMMDPAISTPTPDRWDEADSDDPNSVEGDVLETPGDGREKQRSPASAQVSAIEGENYHEPDDEI